MTNSNTLGCCMQFSLIVCGRVCSLCCAVPMALCGALYVLLDFATEAPYPEASWSADDNITLRGFDSSWGPQVAGSTLSC